MTMAVLLAPAVDLPGPAFDRTTCPTPWKDSFESKGEARRVVKDMERRSRRGKNHFRPQAPYACVCGGFHLASPDRVATYGRW